MPQIQINRLALDKHFLAKAVGQPISEFLIRQSPSLEQSYVSNILAIDVRTIKGDILHLILKSMTPLSPSGFAAAASSADSSLNPESAFRFHMESYPAEIQFYEHIAPLMRKLSPTSSLPIPKLYCADKSLQYLLMEDLRPQGYKVSDVFSGLTLSGVSSVMRSLGKFHALSYALLKQSGKELTQERSEEDNPIFAKTHALKPRFGISLESVTNSLYNHVVDVIELRRDSELAAKMKKFRGLAYEKITQLAERTLSSSNKDPAYFPVIVHGDLWVNNVLFMARENTDNNNFSSSSGADEAVFIDFQQCRRGCVYEDLLYFFVTSTTPSFRREYFEECLEIYFTIFEGTLKAIGEELPENFTVEVLKSTCLDNWDNGFCYGVFAIPFQLGVLAPPQSPATPSPTKTEAENPGGTDSHKSAFEIDGHKTSVELAQEFVDFVICPVMKGAFENSERAIERVEEVAKEMVELGVL